MENNMNHTYLSFLFLTAAVTAGCGMPSISADSNTLDVSERSCSQEEKMLKAFIGLRSFGCSWRMLFPSGQYAKQNETWYHSNGQIAKQNHQWFYASGQYAKQNSTWYYENGNYAKQNSTLYFEDGKYAKQNETWYHPNGRYAKVNGTVYYPDGSVAAYDSDASPEEMVEFITESSCTTGDFQILCAAATQL
jgi:hypothetical protein